MVEREVARTARLGFRPVRVAPSTRRRNIGLSGVAPLGGRLDGVIKGRVDAPARVGDHVAVEEPNRQAAAELLGRFGEIADGIGLGVLQRIEFVKSADRVGVDAGEPGLALEALFFFHRLVDRGPINFFEWRRHLNLSV
jgi:hypothetical protein